MASRRVASALLLLFVGTASISCAGGSDTTVTGVVNPPTNNDPTPPPAAVPTSVSISRGALQFASVGETQALLAEVRSQTGTVMTNVTVQWSSSNVQVATVATNGIVTAVGAGSAQIIATAGTATASIAATVAAAPPPPPATCTTRSAFTEHLFDPSLIKVVTQIGIIGGGNTEIIGRSYVFPIDGQDGVRMPLTAPTTLNVVAAKHYLPPGAPTTGYVADWSLLLDTGCGITIELFHVKDVAASIKAVADTTISNSSAWQQLPTRVPFAAGETFGWYMRGLNSVAFDVIAHDNTVRNRWSNQQRYETGRSNLLDIVCPWNLFAADKRDAYLAAMGAQTGFRVAGAGCGTVERDVAGTPAGQWFRSETVTTSMPFAKEGHYGDPLPIVLGVDSTVYIGHTGPSNDIRIWRENATWKDPASITTSHCYQITNGSTSSGWLWLRMNSVAQMDVSYSDDGTCPASFPSTGFVSYYR